MFALPQARLQACQHTLGREYLYQLEDDADVMDALVDVEEACLASRPLLDEPSNWSGLLTAMIRGPQHAQRKRLRRALEMPVAALGSFNAHLNQVRKEPTRG